MADSQIVCFVSGASRGLGLALVQELSTRYPNSIVYAGVRDPANTPALQTLAASLPPGKVHPVKWTAGDVKANEALAQLIRERHGHVDVVIANAAVAKSTHTPASATPIDDFREMLEVNTTGVLLLFQSLFPLLQASTYAGGAKFVPVSSGAGSITGPWIAQQGVLAGYGASKAAMNYVCRKIHFENEWLTCFPISPGVIATDMLQQYRAADTEGTATKNLESMSKTPEDTARMVMDVIDAATRETHGGEFLSYTGSKVPW